MSAAPGGTAFEEATAKRLRDSGSSDVAPVLVCVSNSFGTTPKAVTTKKGFGLSPRASVLLCVDFFWNSA